ncbi:CheR family methyltransferase [Amaricoccus sp. W119]|uniref:CheR family methyltransferase n=1 Tax=Amaricoccus sp. W119 TaxID=3391833 RepID=UPI0039A651A6
MTRDFQRVAAVVRAVAGISLSEGKIALVEARLTKRLRALGLTGYRDYCALIEGDHEAGRAEREELITAITTNVTQFFREPHHFEILRSRVLPPLIDRAERGGRVRIWSAGCSTGQEPYSIALTILGLAPDIGRWDLRAGCSTGQEPYSIALTILGLAPDIGRWDLRILATDLDRAVLATAKRGVYPATSLEAVPAALRRPHFEPVRAGGEMASAIGPAPRALVRFRKLNLTHDWPMRGGFDVIFCRNVVIYFDAENEAAIWRRLAGRLPEGGWLFVGHSERVNTLALPMLASDGVTTYRKIPPCAAERGVLT